jgi:succinyl-CoA synthetase beta subunit
MQRVAQRLGLSALSLAEQGGAQLQQLRFLNIHEYQGAQLMAKYGVHVPDGVPAFSIKDVEDGATKMADEKGEVNTLRPSTHYD